MQHRTRLKWAASAIVAVVAMLMVAAPALAGVTWCRADPIVRLGDDTYQVIVSIPASNVSQVDGALDFEARSPSWTSQTLLFTDSGFNNYGETVTFNRSVFGNVRFILSVPYHGDSFPVMMDLYKNGTWVKSVTGMSDANLSVSIPAN